VSRLEAGGLSVSGVGGAGEVRIVELPGHPFYVFTLFLPQARSTAAEPHPLLAGFAEAVRIAGARAPGDTAPLSGATPGAIGRGDST
jgi:CTP synthase (UTP-ammonia lyase)